MEKRGKTGKNGKGTEKRGKTGKNGEKRGKTGKNGGKQGENGGGAWGEMGGKRGSHRVLQGDAKSVLQGQEGVPQSLAR